MTFSIAWLLVCQDRLLSREFIRLIKMKVLKIVIWSSHLSSVNSPSGYLSKKTNAWVTFYNIVCDEETDFPSVQEAINVNQLLHVQLQFCSHPFALPSWFADGWNTKAMQSSMLEKFSSYLKNCVTKLNKLLFIVLVSYCGSVQNRRQKVFDRGLQGGLWDCKNWQNSTDL